jgi:hypothetical protein
MLPRFRRNLAAENKAPRAIDPYAASVRRFREYLAEAGMPKKVAVITREHVESLMGEQEGD